MPPPVAAEQSAVPLCVDLDGTLIYTDLVWESLVRLLRHNPLYGFVVPFWLMAGRARLKEEIAKRVDVDPAALPYNEALLEYLRSERSAGRQIILATASDSRLARRVADHLGLFNETLASDGQTNLRGKNKGSRLVEKFGSKAFDYAGNSSVDLPVWEQSRMAIVVNGARGLETKAGKCTDVSRVFPSSHSLLGSLLQAIRPHQWVKNLIIFVPLVTAHKLQEMTLCLQAAVAFVAFNLGASGVYVMNDLVDLEADRHHPGKKQRPFASGALPISVGFIVIPILLCAAAVLAFMLNPGFAAVIGIYFLLTTSYSWRLKQVSLLDVFCLAALYTIRLVAGHEATGVRYSFWLLLFSMFIFLSLALVKRFQELSAARQQTRVDIKGRGYAASDLELVATLGASSGYLAVLVMALYVNSEDVLRLYRTPILLLLICPLLLFWISRVWLIAHRGQMHEDPIVFALKDRASYVIGFLALVVLWMATLDWHGAVLSTPALPR